MPRKMDLGEHGHMSLKMRKHDMDVIVRVSMEARIPGCSSNTDAGTVDILSQDAHLMSVIERSECNSSRAKGVRGVDSDQ